MAQPKSKNRADEEARFEAAAKRLTDFFEENEITQEEIDAALERAAAQTLAEMYPELAAEAEATNSYLSLG